MEETVLSGDKIELLPELDQLLRNAVHEARPEAVRELINMGADADCCVAGNPVVCVAAMAAAVFNDNKDRLAVIDALAEGGADLSLEDSSGRTALDWLSGSESEEIVKFGRKLKAAKKKR